MRGPSLSYHSKYEAGSLKTIPLALGCTHPWLGISVTSSVFSFECAPARPAYSFTIRENMLSTFVAPAWFQYP